MPGSAPRPLAGQRFHLIGVAGRGMAPLAVVARHLGAEVGGCDRAPVLDTEVWLATQGLEFVRSHDPAHLEARTTPVATSVADETEPEVLAARAAGLWHRTDLLAHVLRQQLSVGVTGSHGKGTVAALTTAALAAAGLDPTAALGLSAPELGGFARLGTGPCVAEVDDSDNSLARVDTEVAVVTALDDDHPHLDVTLEQKVAGVGEYVARARRRVLLGASPRAARLASCARAEVWRFGHELTGRVVARQGAETVVALRAPDGVRAQARLRTMVVRPEMGAALAWAAALSLGADPDAAAHGLGELTTLTRRLQLLGERAGVAVVDDMGAKHPASIRGALDTLRRHYPGRRVVAVFEPLDLYLPRWGNRYARALSGADQVLLLPAFGNTDYAGAPAYDEDWPAPCRAPVRRVADHGAVAVEARAVTRPGDVVVVLTHRNASRDLARSVLAGEPVP
jgi:UDP-N-acetylmuramate--alanine ligase